MVKCADLGAGTLVGRAQAHTYSTETIALSLVLVQRAYFTTNHFSEVSSQSECDD